MNLRVTVPATVNRRTLANLVAGSRRAAKAQGVDRSAAEIRALQSLGVLDWSLKNLPDHFTRQPSAMHRWLGEQLDALPERRGTKLNVIGPRGSAKSTVATLAYVLQSALDGREKYIWIVSDTHAQARMHLENVKAELVGNPRLAEAYPAATGIGPVWRGGFLVLRNGVAIEALSTGQRIRGRRRREFRPSLIICDDLESDYHAESAHQRQRSRRWFHAALLSAGTKRTNVVHLATALHRECLALQLGETPGWTSRTFRAIERWPDKVSLWLDWERLYANAELADRKQAARAYYEANRAAMDAHSEVLWPDEEDLYTLMCLRAELGRNAFEREKQSNPVNPELCEWPESYFDERIWFSAWPARPAVKTLALDPSKGGNDRLGDYSAYVLLLVDADGVLYVEADMSRRATPQMVADGVALYQRFQPDAFGVESNQFQSLLAGNFEQEFRAAGVFAPRLKLVDNHVNKLVRIRRLGPLLSSSRLRFKADSPATKLLVNQLKDFPIGDHDDGPDALEMAIRLASSLTSEAPSDGLGERLPIG